MELVRGNLEDSLMELRIGSSKECLGRFLDAQRELYHSQIDQLQRIVVTQCKLTGANPLSQEMAAGALSIKIGKRPRDLLNPKAIKYMQSIFSIKDTISKKETREISALCGVTITQVREFFASHRSRVRKLVRLSREKVIKSNANSGISNGYSPSPDHLTPVSKQTCESAVDLRNVEECSQAAVNTVQPLNAIQQTDQVSKESANVNSVTDSLSCSPKDETIPAIDSDDRNFLENIFSLMRKEETFSGQVKLMEWILQIQNSAVLHWFLTTGGVMILATWLSQAAIEEQTTVLLVIFKVLCHLPLHKALPAQMSAILQTVNKLRFYRTSDISNKARVLLSRWSKMFVRSQALKRPYSVNYPSDIHKEIIRKKRIGEILSDESWLSKVDLPEDVLALGYEVSDYSRKSDTKNTLKLLPATCNDSSKKQGLSVSCSKTKERRKVLLVEQPEHNKHAGRGVQVARAVPVKSSRPISADDIQKAKMRAIFMQRKYGNKDTPANENFSQNINTKIPVGSQENNIFLPKLLKSKGDEDKKSVQSATEPSDAIQKMSVDSNPSLTSLSAKPSLTSSNSKPCLPQELSSEKLNNDCLAWQIPPVMKINRLWRVGAGESSKEMEVQTARIRREKETFHLTAANIPANPKDPWDMEMDFDDSLTPEIPTEQPPDADSMDLMVEGEPPVVTPEVEKDSTECERPVTATTSAPVLAGAPEPDLELLAVLLKNPELVFALTSGQGQHNLTNAETVALLDVLKKSSGGLTGLLNGLGGMTSQTSEPTSLPSPTPPSERTSMEWRTETSEQPASMTKNLQFQHLSGVNVVNVPPAATAPIPSHSLVSLPGAILVSRRVMPSAGVGILSTPQLAEVPKPYSQVPVQLHTTGSLPPAQDLPPPVSHEQHILKTEAALPLKHLPINTVVPHVLRQETFNLEQAHNHEHLPVAFVSSVPPLLPTPNIQEPPMHSPPPSQLSPGTAGGWGREPILGSWRGRANGMRETLAPNSHFSDDQSNANIFSTRSGWTRSVLPGRVAEANGLLDTGELEPWSPERSPLAGLEYPYPGNYPESRRGGQYRRGDRPERSRQYNAGHRDRHRPGRRWRDRDRRP